MWAKSIPVTDGTFFFLIFWWFFFCRNDEFRKKASISFGIQFDKHKYGLLQKRLHEILIHKDRVS